jgi:hypothetical protein
MSNNPNNLIRGGGNFRFSLTLPSNDGTPLASVTGVATTDILTKVAHGLLNGQPVLYVSGTGGAGLVAATRYYVIRLSADTFSLATTYANAVATVPVKVDFTTDLSAGTVTPTDLRLLPASYTADFGNQVKTTLKPGSEKKEHYGVYKGVKSRDKTWRIKSTAGLEVVLDELSPDVIAYILGAASGGAPQPGRTFDGYGIYVVEQEGEPQNTAGAAILVWGGFKCQISFEGDLAFDAEAVAESTMTVDIDLGAPGTYLASPRPVVA